jgi:hypothetical protein
MDKKTGMGHTVNLAKSWLVGVQHYQIIKESFEE